MANLLLWRHAEAEITSASGLDIDRKLTPKGAQDAKNMARWLRRQLPDDCHVITSPATRCMQTALTLNADNSHHPFMLHPSDDLKVDASPQTMVDFLLRQDEHQYTLIVGHQPNLGEAICHLIGLDAAHCVVKKGAVWWIRTREANGQIQRYVYALQQPATINM